jgi:DNA repair protein RecN (Recombination protein N)
VPLWILNRQNFLPSPQLMLQKIQIQNYAIIDHLEIDFHDGMTIITGETGAGKSILLGALGLIMGKRADTKVLFDSDRKCIVEATFDIKNYQLKDFFEQHELDYEVELSIRRELAPNGKSRAFINDSPVTLDVVGELTDNLIDIHQQFDTSDIQKNKYQIDVLDALAGNTEMAKYTEEYKRYKKICLDLDALTAKSQSASQEVEFLKFQIQEFDQLAVIAGEQKSLESSLQILESAEEIKKNASLISHVIADDEHAINGQLRALYQQFSSIKNIDKTYHDLYDRLVSAHEELADIAKEADKISEVTEFDPETIQQHHQRLNLIYRLEKKHNVSSDLELITIHGQIQQKLDSFQDLTQGLADLEKEKSSLHKKLLGHAKVMSEIRKKSTSNIEKQVHDMLASLSMEHAYIKFDIQTEESLSAHGCDKISLLFSPNKGSEFLPVKDTASGGELSRLALCVKSLTAGAMTLPTLIFDEIDAGVSGEVAQKMSLILQKLSRKHQLISITHSPQIASKADSHYWVYKQDTPTRTITGMRPLSTDDRVTEIAKMLSGNPPTAAAIANAKELIDG